MNLLRDAPLWAQLLLFALLLVAAAQDIVRRQISTWLCLAVIIAAIAAAVAIGPTLALWQNVMIFALLLAIGTPLYGAGWLGGGMSNCSRRSAYGPILPRSCPCWRASLLPAVCLPQFRWRLRAAAPRVAPRAFLMALQSPLAR